MADEKIDHFDKVKQFISAFWMQQSKLDFQSPNSKVDLWFLKWSEPEIRRAENEEDLLLSSSLYEGQTHSEKWLNIVKEKINHKVSDMNR